MAGKGKYWSAKDDKGQVTGKSGETRKGSASSRRRQENRAKAEREGKSGRSKEGPKGF